ncbi:MAG TPA: hypothetical protein VFS30_04660 [Dehalococcoidia bacterium]|nr:hypothetical protein [Dehalococcoidia bacterium]
MYAEYGRLIGLLLKATATGHVGPFPRMSLVVLVGLTLAFLPGFAGSLDVVVDRRNLYFEVTYATLGGFGGFGGLLVWVALRALFRWRSGA